MWIIELECSNIRAQNWNLEVDDDFEESLFQNLEDCSKALSKCSKTHFPQNRKKKVDSILCEI